MQMHKKDINNEKEYLLIDRLAKMIKFSKTAEKTAKITKG